MTTPAYPRISLWMEQLPPLAPRAALEGERHYDVAIVGGGYTGLWTAYYLKTLAPDLAVCILEAQVCGFGASGRNGGWMMANMEGEAKFMRAADDARRTLVRQQIHGILPAVAAVLAEHQLDCDYRHGGGIFAAARYPEQEAAQRAVLQQYYSLGYQEDDFAWLDAAQLESRLRIHKPFGAIYTPHIARIHPAKLARGLAAINVSLGVDIFEHSPVLSLGPTSLHCAQGGVTAATRVLAIEGFSYHLKRHRQRVLPLQSRIIATEPLSAAQWDEIGLARREVFCDASPLITYGQRSADDRLVFGSRGSYRFGGQPRSEFSADGAAFEAIHRLLLQCLPQLSGATISHHWGGTLGIPRGGAPHAVYDPVTGTATAGGYLGEGVGAANLMARTLADLILQRDSVLAGMPWAHRCAPEAALRRWEPEPLRWLVYKVTDLVLGWEEASYAGRAPAWRRGLLRNSSALLAALRT